MVVGQTEQARKAGQPDAGQHRLAVVKLGMWRPECGQQPRPRTRWNQRYLEVARLGMSREHALDAQFLGSDALWRADRGDQREVREALIASPKGDG